MQVPAAAQIEAAQDQLKQLADPANKHNWVLADQQKELSSALGAPSDDFRKGYELGVQSGRVMIETNPVAQANGISL